MRQRRWLRIKVGESRTGPLACRPERRHLSEQAFNTYHDFPYGHLALVRLSAAGPRGSVASIRRLRGFSQIHAAFHLRQSAQSAACLASYLRLRFNFGVAFASTKQEGLRPALLGGWRARGWGWRWRRFARGICPAESAGRPSRRRRRRRNRPR